MTPGDFLANEGKHWKGGEKSDLDWHIKDIISMNPHKTYEKTKQGT
jgi:hypothetical protein